jgi:hypothetical protein
MSRKAKNEVQLDDATLHNLMMEALPTIAKTINSIEDVNVPLTFKFSLLEKFPENTIFNYSNLTQRDDAGPGTVWAGAIFLKALEEKITARVSRIRVDISSDEFLEADLYITVKGTVPIELFID